MSQKHPRGLFSGLFDPKFDCALNLNPSRNFLENFSANPDTSQPEVSRLLLTCTPLDITSSVVGVECLGHYISCIPSKARLIWGDTLVEDLNVANRVLQYQELHLFKNSSPSVIGSILEAQLTSTEKIGRIPPSLLQYWNAWKELDQIVDIYKRIRSSSVSQQKEMCSAYNRIQPCMGAKWHISWNQMILEFQGCKYLISRDQLLLFHNKLYEISIGLTLGWLLSGVCWSTSFYQAQLDLLSMMATCVKEAGNNAYSLFKVFDGLATAVIMSVHDSFENQYPLLEMTSTALQAIPNCKATVERILAIFREHPDQEGLELSGMAKLLGHPDIDTPRGVEKLYGRVMAPIDVPLGKVIDLICCMKQNFCKQFFRKHQRWPLVSFKYAVNRRIVLAVMRGVWVDDPGLPESLPDVVLSDYQNLDIDQVAVFDKVNSLLPILKDTALAYTRSCIESPTLNAVRKIEDRRTLLYFLMTVDPPREVREYIQAYCDRDPLALEYLVIKLTQKERELKPEGRFFGQSPFGERARRCIYEENIAKLMKSYNCSQAMTLTEMERLRKMALLTGLQSKYKDHYLCYISVDVEGWNNCFRRNVCEPVGREFFDKIFGETIFSSVMDVFELSRIVVQDYLKEFSWMGQMGGIEGLAQKFWTWVYETVASRIAEMTGFPYYIMVNGDDLRVVLAIPHHMCKKENLPTFIRRLCESFKTEYGHFGFTLKVEETYASMVLLGFGKVYFLKQAIMTGTMKKGTKLHGMANLMGDLPFEYIGGVMSEAMSTIANSVNHRYIYLTSLVIIQLYLRKFCSEYSSLDHHHRILLMMFPSCFGGIPVLPYVRTLAKGDSDLECCWMSLAMYLRETEPNLGNRLLEIYTESMCRTRTYQGLAINPYSLPLTSGITGSAFLQQEVRSVLDTITTNYEFSQLLRSASREKTMLFIERLYSAEVIPARAFSVIYETSAAGQVDELVRRFVSAKTMLAPLSIVKGYKRARNQVAKAHRLDVERIKASVLSVVKAKGNVDILNVIHQETCPTLAMNSIREWCWGKKILSLTFPCPVDQLEMYYPSTAELEGLTFEMDRFTLILERIPEPTNVCYTKGSSDITLNKTTSLKLLPPDLRISGSSPGLARVEKLLKIYPMLNELGESVIEYVKMNLKELTGIDPHVLLSSTWQHVSGSIAHRVPSNHWSPLVGPNEVCNRSSYIEHITTTNHITRKMSGDWSINFGHLLAYEICLMMYVTEFNAIIQTSQKTQAWFKLSSCAGCIYEMTDRQVEWISPPPSLFSDIASNTYIGFSYDERIQLAEDLAVQLSTKLPRLNLVLDSDDAIHKSLAIRSISNLLLREVSGMERIPDREKTGHLTQEDLNALYHLHPISMIGLTELKHLPPEELLKSTVEFVLQWAMVHSPQHILTNSLTILSTVKLSVMPLYGLACRLIETGYTDLLQDPIRSAHTVPLPFDSGNPESIQRTLLSYSFQEIDRMFKGEAPFDPEIQILITQYVSNDQMLRALEYQYKLGQTKIVTRWITTPDGQEIMARLREHDFTTIGEFLVSFCSLRVVKPVNETQFSSANPLFYYDLKTTSGEVLGLLCHLAGISAKKSHGVIGMAEQYRNEQLPDEDDDDDPLSPLASEPSVAQFLSSYCIINVIPTDQAISIVRGLDNQEYTQLFSPPKKRKRDNSRITTNRPTIEPTSVSFRSTLQPPAMEEFHQAALEELGRGLCEHVVHPDRECPSLAYRVFGTEGSAASKLYQVLETLGLGYDSLEGCVLCAGDGPGGYTRLFIKTQPNTTIVYNTLPSDFAIHTVRLPECFDVNFQDFARRVSMSSVSAGYGDLTSEQTIVTLKTEIENSGPLVVITCDCQYYHEDPDTNLVILRNLLELCKHRMVDEGIFVYKTLWFQDSICLRAIVELQKWFVSIRIVKPRASYDWSYEVFLVGFGFRNFPDDMQSILPNKTIGHIVSFNNKLINRMNPDMYWADQLPFNIYVERASLIKSALGVVDMGIIARPLGNPISALVMLLGEPIDALLNDFMGQLNDLHEKQVNSVLGFFQPGDRLTEPTFIRHSCRMLFYTRLLLFWLQDAITVGVEGVYQQPSLYLDRAAERTLDTTTVPVPIRDWTAHLGSNEEGEDWRDHSLINTRRWLVRLLWIFFWSSTSCLMQKRRRL